MSVWATISSVLGVGAAALSLLLAVLRFLDTRPVMVLEWVVGNTGHLPSFRLRIRNTSRYPIHIGEVRPRLPRNQPAAFERIWCSDWELRDYLSSALSRRLDVYLAEGQELFIMFAFQEVSHLLLTVSWYRHQPVIFPTFPKVIYRSKQKLKQLRAHPISVED